MCSNLQIVNENKRRHDLFNIPYNPVSGYGDTVGTRTPFTFTYLRKKINWNIPVHMCSERITQLIDKHKTIERVAQATGILPIPLFNLLIKVRCKHDHEFWAATCAKIQDKETKKIIPFILNKPQRKLQSIIEEQREAGKPVRIILCKSRQWGGSTNTQLDMLRTQIFCHERWHSVIATNVEDQARTIRSMTTRVAKNHPPETARITIKNFERSSKNKHIIQTDAIISIGSMQQPDNLRSQDIMMAHLSEVGLWKETEGKKPEDLIQTIVGSIPDIPGTMIIKESTAKGVGNYFHSAWQEAVQGKSNDIPVFVAWHEIAMYQKEITGSVQEFVESFTGYDKFLWQSGATLEGINWYRNKLREFKGDTWRMQSEFPTTPDEAFQSDARRVFSPIYVKTAEQYVKDPLMTGELSAKTRTGPDALTDIRFAEQHAGNLKIWIAPTHHHISTSMHPHSLISPHQHIANRFCGFLDVGGRTHAADYSVLTVIDRHPMLEGKPVELAARWRGHTDQDILAWLAVMICKWYDNALLGVEVNSLHIKGEPDHSYTILDEIAGYYNNLFHRSTVEDIINKIPKKYGFHTNKASKEMILDRLNAALRDTGYIERDAIAINEFNSFEEKPDGSKGAVEGMHDDIVISTAGAVWLATSYMEPPKIINPMQTKNYSRNIVNEATF
jgi:hypothetical protein